VVLLSFIASASKVCCISSGLQLQAEERWLTQNTRSTLQTICAYITNFTNMIKTKTRANHLQPVVLLSHDVFTFRKVLVSIFERLGDLFRRTDVWLALILLSWLQCFALEEWVNIVCLSISIGQLNQSIIQSFFLAMVFFPFTCCCEVVSFLFIARAADVIRESIR
jgi:hypothetical protein